MDSITKEPEAPTYEDNVEGMLQYRADLSLWYSKQIKEAKTPLKRELYTRKLKKNNNKIYKLLVRTPNAYNPFIQWMEAKDGEEVSDTGEVTSGFLQVLDDNTETE